MQVYGIFSNDKIYKNNWNRLYGAIIGGFFIFFRLDCNYVSRALAWVKMIESYIIISTPLSYQLSLTWTQLKYFLTPFRVKCDHCTRILGKFLFKNGFSACGKVMFFRRETYLGDLLFDHKFKVSQQDELSQYTAVYIYPQ